MSTTDCRANGISIRDFDELLKAPLAQQLIDNALELSPRIGVERSIKFSDKHLQDERFLLSLPRPTKEGPIICLLNELRAPTALMSNLSSELSTAAFFHLGYEGNESSAPRIKVYFEQRLPNRTGTEPILVHRAYKWRLGSQRYSHDIYRQHTDIGKCRVAIEEIFDAKPNCHSMQIAETFLKRAEEAGDDIFFLEVCSENQSRHSFDLRLYDLDLKLRTGLAELGVPTDNLDPKIANAPLGHISSGLDNTNNEFVTLYFGATDLRRQVRVGNALHA